MNNSDPSFFSPETTPQQDDEIERLVDQGLGSYFEVRARVLGSMANSKPSSVERIEPWTHDWLPAEPNEYYKCRNGRNPTDIEDAFRLPPVAIRNLYNGYKGFRNSASRSVVALEEAEQIDSSIKLPDVMKALRDYLVGQMIIDDANNKDLQIIQKTKLFKYRQMAQQIVIGLQPDELENLKKIALDCHKARVGVWTTAVKALEDKHPFLLADEKR